MSEEAPNTWECGFQELPPQVTVGAELKLHCKGPTEGLSKESLQFEFPEPARYSLVRLRVEGWEADQADLIVTSYRPGQHGLENVPLTDGHRTVQVQAGTLDVISVMDPANPVNEPYGPMGPFRLGLPWYIWFALILFLVLLAAAIYRWVRKRLERQGWLKEIESTKGMLSPFAAFNKSLRLLGRDFAWAGKPDVVPAEQASLFVTRLSEAFRLYLAQELMVPVHRWSRRAVLKELKKHQDWLYKQEGNALDRLLQELERAQQPPRPLTEIDCNQLLELCRARGDAIWHLAERHRRGGT